MLRWSTHDDPSAWESDWRDNADAFDDDDNNNDDDVDEVNIDRDDKDDFVVVAIDDLKLFLKEVLRLCVARDM